MDILGEVNCRSNGGVEAYIYRMFNSRRNQLSIALHYCLRSTPNEFNIKHFIDMFWKEPGLKRSLDKIYEIIVYSLFASILDALEFNVEVSINMDKIDIFRYFSDFTDKIVNLNVENPKLMQTAKIFRVGVTNASDRGLDMYSNWGPIIQIKHLTLNEELAGNIVDSVTSDRVIIVCKNAEQSTITLLLSQIGWKSRIQSIVTEENLIDWYDRALKGNYSNIMGEDLLYRLANEIKNEFPSVEEKENIITKRIYDYNNLDSIWELI